MRIIGGFQDVKQKRRFRGVIVHVFFIILRLFDLRSRASPSYCLDEKRGELFPVRFERRTLEVTTKRENARETGRDSKASATHRDMAVIPRRK